MAQREIKFRFWRDGRMQQAHQLNAYVNSDNNFAGDGEILMQYTGIKDKNGKEIYEGDLFNVANNKTYVVKYIESGTSDYELRAATFVLWYNEEMFFPFDEFAMENGKVIGNIHQNTDLLK